MKNNNRIYVLLKDVDFFGKVLKAGETVYREDAENPSNAECFQNNGGIIMRTPLFDLPIIMIQATRDYFLPTFSVNYTKHNVEFAGVSEAENERRK